MLLTLLAIAEALFLVWLIRIIASQRLEMDALKLELAKYELKKKNFKALAGATNAIMKWGSPWHIELSELTGHRATFFIPLKDEGNFVKIVVRIKGNTQAMQVHTVCTACGTTHRKTMSLVYSDNGKLLFSSLMEVIGELLPKESDRTASASTGFLEDIT